MNAGRSHSSISASFGLLVAGALMLAGALSAVGCGENKAADGYEIEDGSLRGELAVYMSDDSDGQSETRYALRAPSGLERPLLFDRDVSESDVSQLTAGVELKIWGSETPAGVRVTSFRVMSPPLEERSAALRSGAVIPDRSFAFVLIDFGGGVNITADTALARMVNDTNSIRNYYLYASYGRQNITTQVFGPLTSTALGTCTTNDTNNIATNLRGMIPGTFQHYLWYFGSKQSACVWSGLASVGTAAKPSKDTWYNASTGCVVLVQEPGHNFGMQHSSSIRCPGASMADDTTTCTADEYGDIYDPMGGGCKHMNAWQKGYQGWFGGCNGVNVASSGTFKLLPYEMRCDGVQFLQIKSPKTRTIMRSGGGGPTTTETLDYYFVELRTALDFDGTLGGGTSLTPRVLLHIANDIVASTKRAIHPYLIDMTPATTSGSGKGFADAALAVGQTFTDPAGGLSITATAVSATEATITVDVAGGTVGPTCLDDSPFTGPGAGTESCVANTATPVGMAAPPGTGGTVGSGGAVAVGAGGRPGTGGTASTGGRTGTGGAVVGSGGSNASGGTGQLGTGGQGAGPTTDAGSVGLPASGGMQGAGGPGVAPTVTNGCGCAVGSGGPLSGVGLAGLAGFMVVCCGRRLGRGGRRRSSRAARAAS